jgi:hypothetical protein
MKSYRISNPVTSHQDNLFTKVHNFKKQAAFKNPAKIGKTKWRKRPKMRVLPEQGRNT